jgi:predicted amino acid-binding ACT domain protein
MNALKRKVDEGSHETQDSIAKMKKEFQVQLADTNKTVKADVQALDTLTQESQALKADTQALKAELQQALTQESQALKQELQVQLAEIMRLLRSRPPA